MIKLDPQYVLQTQFLSGGQVVSSTVTDTLYLTQFSIDLSTGNIQATIQRGTMLDSFQINQPTFQVTVSPDGSFTLADNSYAGTIPGIASFVSAMKAELDQFILASGLVTGTAE